MNTEKEKVLIVDDNLQNIQLVAGIMEREGYEVVLSMSGRSALEYARENAPDIILLDIMMPEIDGFQVCHILKENAVTRSIPVIFLTARGNEGDIAQGFNMGAVDYVTKPFSSIELAVRVRTHLKLSHANKVILQYNQKLEKVNKQLNKALDQLKIAANTDPLTSLSNRRYIIDHLKREILRYKRYRGTFVLLIADIDFFKKFNDVYGHDCGDMVLVNLARIFMKNIREQDCVARWGGEEFLFLLTETDQAGGLTVAEKIRKEVEISNISYENQLLKLTVTIGVAEYNAPVGMDNILKNADMALYHGKETGRNRVIPFDETLTAVSGERDV